PRRNRSPRLAARYGRICRSKNSRSADSDSVSVGAITLVAGGGATGFGGAGVAVTGVGGETDFGATSAGATPVTASVPDGIGAPSGTRAVGVPIVSGGLFSGGRGETDAFSSGFFSGVVIVSAT